MSLEEVYERMVAKGLQRGQKLGGTFSGSECFRMAGGTWVKDAIQWVDYWNDDDRNDPNCLYPWADMTLMVWSDTVGDTRPATREDLRRLGYMTEVEWEEKKGW